MELGFEPVCDMFRAGSSYLDMSKAGSTLVADLLARASSLLAS